MNNMRRHRKNQQRQAVLRNRIMILAILVLIAVILVLVTSSVLRKTRKNDPAGSSAGTESVQSESVQPRPSKEAQTPTPTPTPAVTEAPEEQADPATEEQADEEPEPEETPTPEPEKPVVTLELDESQLSSDYALFVRNSDWEVLYDKNANDIMFPASMTKIMTAVLALENLPDLSVPITVWEEDSNMYFTADASVAGFEAWEEVNALDLLYGVMLPSGADACEALARYIAGSREAFVDMMNAKAAELGMQNTHFMNCTGLHEETHFSTCHDMAILLSYALTIDAFRSISSTSGWICTPTDFHPDSLYLESTLAPIESVQLDNGAVILGGKTGTEVAAGRCLASYGEYQGEEYILITAHAPSDSVGNLQDSLVLFGSLR